MVSLPTRTRSVVLTEAGRAQPYVTSGALEVQVLELDPPRHGELLVAVKAAGICHSDLSVVDGSRPRPVPMALGHEAAGVVEAVGENVQDVAIGDHVVLVFVPSCGSCPECVAGTPALCRNGARSNTQGDLLGGGRRLSLNDADVHHHLGVSAFSERVVVDRSSAVIIPESVPLETAALFGCALLTGAGAVFNSAQVQSGDSVAVFGLGGVGLAALLAAAVAGAEPILAVDPVASKRELAVSLGASAVFSPEEASAGIRCHVPEGVRFAFEAVGSEAVMAQAFDVTARGGATVAVGLPHPDRNLVLPAARVVAEARTILGSYMGAAVPQRDIPRLLGLWRAGRLPVERLKGAVLGLDDVAGAFDLLVTGETLRQIVVP
jgi:alcohol dehydrogenase